MVLALVDVVDSGVGEVTKGADIKLFPHTFITTKQNSSFLVKRKTIVSFSSSFSSLLNPPFFDPGNKKIQSFIWLRNAVGC